MWTDERLDDLSARMDAGFERVDGELRELRRELSTGMAEMRAEHRADMQGLREEIHGVRTDLGGRIEGLDGRIDGLGGRIDALQVTMLRLGGGMMIGFAGVIAATLARG